MANVQLKDLTFAGLSNTYIVPQNAEEFTTTDAYTAGKRVSYQGKFYKFKVDHAAGAWNSAEVDELYVGDEIETLESGLDELSDQFDAFSGAVESRTTYLDPNSDGNVQIFAMNIGGANGVPVLDSNGKVPAANLPSYVDDIIEGYYRDLDGKFYSDSGFTTEITGETGKIYLDLSNNQSYRWSGSVFVDINDPDKENVSNKVTAWSGTTTDVHYPSEKLVKDNIDRIDANIADEYDNTDTYDKGDLYLHNGVLNKAKQNISTAETWDSTHWDETTVGEELVSQSRRIDQVTNESKTVTAQPIQIDDGVEGMPVKNLSIAFSPKQSGSGDPSPDNVRAITGYDSIKLIRTAKNICGGDRLLESFIEGSCAANRVGTDTDGRYYTLYAGSATSGKSYVNSYTFKPNTQYTFIYSIKKPDSDNVRPNLAFYYTDGTYSAFPVNGTTGKVVRTEVSTAGKTVSSIGAYYANADETKLYLDESGLFEGNLATSDFVPYEGETITFPFSTTRYGGTIDVLRGKATITKGRRVFDGSSDEGWFKFGSGTASAFAMASQIDSSSLVIDNPAISNYLKWIDRTATWGDNDNWISIGNSNTVPTLVTGIQSITTVSDWETYLSSNNLEVVFPLRTPIEIDLTPEELSLFSGYNYIYSTGGSRVAIADKNITMEYGEAIAALNEKIDRLDGDDVAYDSSATYMAGSVGDELQSQSRWIGEIADDADTTVSGNPVEIDGISVDGMPVKSTVITLNPIQSGTGDPTPTNIRPFSGRTAVQLTVQNAASNPTKTNTFNIEFPTSAGTVYGGTVDLENGILTVNKRFYTFDGTEEWVWPSAEKPHQFRYNGLPGKKYGSSVYTKVSQYDFLGNGTTSALATLLGSKNYSAGSQVTTVSFWVRNDSCDNATEIKAAMIGVEVVYELATPVVYNIPAEIINLFKGYTYAATTDSNATIKITYGAYLSSLSNEIDRVVSEKTSSIATGDEDSETKYPSIKGMKDWVSSHTTHRQDTYYSGTSTFGSYDFTFASDGTYFLTATFYNVTSNNIAYGFLSVDVGRFINLTWLISPQSNINITVTPDTTNYDKITVTSTNKYLAVGIFKM